MAYCNKCGAYIPDGQTKCLACGYDEQEERQNAASAAARAAESATGERYGFDNGELRRKLEEQRRKQQEQSYAWAQQERERRERAQQRAEREREESRARAQQASSSSAEYGAGTTPKAANRSESKLFAVLSYISVLSLIPLLFRRDDEYALYHARQGLALLIYGVVADILGAIPGIGWIFGVFRVVCVFKGMINAANDIKEPLPYIGKFAERFR